MSSPPSARPPSATRRPPDLDSPEARAFVEGAENRAAGNAARDATVDRTRQATREMLRPLTLRIPDSLHAKLTHIAENGSRSMNQFVIEALSPAVEEQLRKIAKRKELGLD